MQIAIIEDNSRFRASLEEGLRLFNDCNIIHSLANALHVSKNFKIGLPDIALIDINMPGINGIEAVKEIAFNFPTVQCVMLTINDDLDMVIKSIQNGAKGYLLKNKDGINKIVDCLRVLYSGNYNEEFPLNGTLANRVLEHFVNVERRNSNTLDTFNLTPRQKEILIYLHEGHSYKQIAELCNISIETLNSHIRAIYPKLNINSRNEIRNILG